MAGISKKQFQDSVRLAESVATWELRIEEVAAHKDMRLVVKNYMQILEEKLEKLKRDMLAVEFLPQARVRVRMLRAREKFLEKSSFGQLLDAVVDSHNAGHPQVFFTEKADAVSWDKFIKALKKGRVESALMALRSLLVCASVEMLQEDAPPLPRPYVYQRMKYSPQDVH